MTDDLGDIERRREANEGVHPAPPGDGVPIQTKRTMTEAEKQMERDRAARAAEGLRRPREDE